LICVPLSAPRAPVADARKAMRSRCGELMYQTPHSERSYLASRLLKFIQWQVPAMRLPRSALIAFDRPHLGELTLQ
jgi:hypothetical protein